MSTTDVAGLVVAIAANLVGVFVVAAMWRHRRRRRRVAASSHPVARPPIRVDLVGAGASTRLRVSTPSGAPLVTIDLLSVRGSRPDDDWHAVPLDDEPVWLGPGSTMVVPADLTAVTDDPSELDVVVAWTAHVASGPTSESRLFRLPEEREEPVRVRAASELTGWAAAAVIVLLAASAALVGSALLDRDDDVDAGGESPAATVPAVDSIASPATTAPNETDVGPDPTTTAAPVERPTTTAPRSTSTTTTDPADGGSTSTSTTDPASPTVVAEGRIEPCRFGSQCLVVGFSITGFDPSPDTYVCEFDDGSRFSFTFDGDGAASACSSGDANATVTVEVAGVRSAPVSRP